MCRHTSKTTAWSHWRHCQLKIIQTVGLHRAIMPLRIAVACATWCHSGKRRRSKLLYTVAIWVSTCWPAPCLATVASSDTCHCYPEWHNFPAHAFVKGILHCHYLPNKSTLLDCCCGWLGAAANAPNWLFDGCCWGAAAEWLWFGGGIVGALAPGGGGNNPGMPPAPPELLGFEPPLFLDCKDWNEL